MVLYGLPMRKVHMILASLERRGNSLSTCGLRSSSSRMKCKECVTMETTSVEDSIAVEALMEWRNCKGEW